jgi:hypothetical protein
MSCARHRRLLVAIEPRLLEGALGLVLQASMRGSVVRLHDVAGPVVETHYDAAVVTDDFAPLVCADVVLILADGGAAGRGRIRTRGAARAVTIRSCHDVVGLLVDWLHHAGRLGSTCAHPPRRVP